METKRNADNNEMTNLELVLEQIANEQKSQTKSLTGLVSAINSLTEHVSKFEEEIYDSKPVSLSTDTLPIQELIQKGISDIKFILLTQQQKPVLRKYQLLLFPEQDARLFYKIVFGRWFLWLTLMLSLNNIYKLGIHWSDNRKETNLRLIQNDRIKKSWDYLYFQHGKSLRRLMDSAYYKLQ